MQPSMGSQRVGLDENNLEIPGGNQGVAESGQNHEGPKKKQVFKFSPVSILLFYLSTHLFIHRCCIPSTHQELLGTVIGSWGKQTSHASWSLDSPSACVWGIELVPCFLMNLRTTFLTSP